MMDVDDDDMDLERREQLQELAADAVKLRGKINPLPAGDAHDNFWAKRGANGNGYLDDPHAPKKELKLSPADLAEFLECVSLMQHPIATDGKCQYRAI